MSSRRLPGRCAFAATLLASLAVTGASDFAHAQWSPWGQSGPYGQRGQYGQRGEYGRDWRRDEYDRRSRREDSSRESGREQYGQPRPGATPLLAVVSLSDQRITVYEANGKMLQAPVSTGQTGYETPAGIFTIVQKKEDHRSNIYEDGEMPFMQRITWTGIALHGGTLPGRPASHGCVRLPHPFARQLFGLTEMGLRVVLVRDDIVPADITHPALFKPRAGHGIATPAVTRISAPGSQAAATHGSAKHLQMLKSVAQAKTAEAEAASRRAKQARQVAQKKAAEAAPAAKAVKAAEANQAKAQAALKAAEGALEKAGTLEATEKAEAAKSKAEAAKSKAAAKVTETAAQIEAAKAQAQAKSDAAARAEEEAQAAEAASYTATEAAGEARRRLSPISVFVSRNTQRIYIRQANEPLYEGPVTIREPDRSIGTFVFTALGYVDNGADVRWNVVSMYKDQETAGTPAPAHGSRKSGEGATADVTGAKAALDRISFPPDVVERVSEVVLPGSSLIISDERASIETGKDTDFVVLVSGEPQGALKVRKREVIDPFRNDPWRNDPWGRNSGSSRRSPYGGGGFRFW